MKTTKRFEDEALPYALPTPEQSAAIAAAVVSQAISDLGSDASRCTDPLEDARRLGEAREAREEAFAFLTVGLWSPEIPWSRLLGLTKVRFLKALRRHPALRKFDRLQFRDGGPSLSAGIAS
jgi:hypothetical protein